MGGKKRCRLGHWGFFLGEMIYSYYYGQVPMITRDHFMPIPRDSYNTTVKHSMHTE